MVFISRRVQPISVVFLLCSAWAPVASCQVQANSYGVLQQVPHSQQASSEKEAAIAKALRLRNHGDQEGALQVLKGAAVALPNDPELLLDLGIQAQSMHRLQTASEALRASLAIAPANAKAIYALARVEMDQGDFMAAETHWKSYLQAHPNDTSAHYGLGHLYQMQQQTEKATAEFRRSIELQPVQTESYYQLGQMALDAHSDAEAKAMFDKTLARMPAHGGALTGTGILAYRAKNYGVARASLDRAVLASPDYQPAHYYLGLTLARLGEKEASQIELDKAAALALAQQGKGQPILNQ